MAIDAETFEIIGFEIYKKSPNDSKLLVNFVEKLCNSRKLRQGDAVICDRGFAAKKNYHILISRFLLIPIIFARKNTNVKRGVIIEKKDLMFYDRVKISSYY